jgi:hypothetical protein
MVPSPHPRVPVGRAAHYRRGDDRQAAAAELVDEEGLGAVAEVTTTVDSGKG